MAYITAAWGISELAAAAFCGAGGFKCRSYHDGRREWYWDDIHYSIDEVKSVFGTDFTKLPVNERMEPSEKDQFDREGLYVDHAIPNRYTGDYMDNIVRLVKEKIILDPLVIIERMDNILQSHHHGNIKLKHTCIEVKKHLKAYMNGKIQLNQIGVIIIGNSACMGLVILDKKESNRLNIHPDKY